MTKKLTMKEKLLITKDTLQFLLETNEEHNPYNKYLVRTIEIIKDEIDYAIGL